MEQNQNGGVGGTVGVSEGGEGLSTPVSIPQSEVTAIPPVTVSVVHDPLPPFLKRLAPRHIAVGLIFLLLLIAGGVFFVSRLAM